MTKKKRLKKSAKELHKNVPPDWYHQSIRDNIIQRFWHTQRFKEVSKFIEPIKGKALDIGAADGVFTKIILDKSGAKKVVGIDVLDLSVDWANKHWKSENRLNFKVGDAHRLKEKNETYDAIFALEVLEHVHYPKKALTEIKRVLKKGGYAILLVPTDIWYFRFFWDNFWTKTRGKIWNDTHLHSYTSDQLVKLCKESGFKVEKNKKFLFSMLQVIKISKV